MTATVAVVGAASVEVVAMTATVAVVGAASFEVVAMTATVAVVGAAAIEVRIRPPQTPARCVYHSSFRSCF